MLELNHFPRHELIPHPTSITKLKRLSAILGGPNIYVKRDDTNFLGGGGSKLRKLEFYLGAARQAGCDTIIAMGAMQSNHARLSAAAALSAGFACEIILGRKVPRDDSDYLHNGNLLLDRIMGVTIHETDASSDLMALALARKAELEIQGKKVYIVPFGGSCALGSLGYVYCAFEIAAQEQSMGVAFDSIVLANGSSGTHAGLLAGCELSGSTAKVIAYNVLKPVADTLPVTSQITQEIFDLLQSGKLIDESKIYLDDSYLGAGYGIPTDSMREAVRLMAHEEGLFLDPVYSGKAFAGLVADIKQGKFTGQKNVLFMMTGGVPGLYAYQSEF